MAIFFWFECTKTAKITTLVLGLITLISLIAAGVFWVRDYHMQQHYQEVTAVVIDNFISTDRRTSWSDVQFELDGQAYTVRHEHFWFIGQSIDLLAHVDNPHETLTAGTVGFEANAAVINAGTFGFVFLIYLLNFLFNQRRDRKMLELIEGSTDTTIDRIDWHWDNITDEIPEGEYEERAGAHIGYFIEWAYKQGFMPDNLKTHEIDEYKMVVSSEKSGIQFLIENCDGKFWKEDLNKEGQEFTAFAYGQYMRDLEEILEDKPYSARYNQQDLQNVFKYLDGVYADYLAILQYELQASKRETLIQRH